MVSKTTLEIAREDGFHWGDSGGGEYFRAAERDMDQAWTELVHPFIHDLLGDGACALDLACGRGRNTTRLLDHFALVLAVDINPENVTRCRRRFADDPRVVVRLTDGCSLSFIGDSEVSFVYCFDSMVHFDVEVVLSYLKEFVRILKPGACGFCHHSNYTGAPGRDLRHSPQWRNFMSKELFAHLCLRNGLEIVRQEVIDWVGEPGLDCLTAFRRPQ